MEIRRKNSRPASPDAISPKVAEAIIREQLVRAQSSQKTLFDKTRAEIPPSRRAFYLDRCHAKQRAFIEDPADQKAALVPRRGGKSTASIFLALLTGEEFPGSIIPYMVPDSRAHAKELFWLPLKKANETLRLGIVFKEVEKVAIMQNGSRLTLLGAKDKDDVGRLRGNPYPLVVMDEAKDYGPHFEELVQEAIIPGLDDYGGTIAMIGTPGKVLSGLFYEITTGQHDKWSVHRWDRRDNTFLRAEAQDVYAIARARGIDPQSPYFRREYLGKWVPDEAELAYPYSEERNGWDGYLDPARDWRYILAVDFGERDDTAFVVVAFREGDPHLYFVETFNRKGMIQDEMIAKTVEFTKKYQPMVQLVGDAGGFGRPIVTYMNARYGIPMEPVDKKPGYKAGAIESMRSDFMLGRIKAMPHTPLTAEWAKVNKDPETGLTDHTDLGDAALYAFITAQHWITPTNYIDSKPIELEPWQKEELSAINKTVESRKKEWWGRALSE